MLVRKEYTNTKVRSFLLKQSERARKAPSEAQNNEKTCHVCRSAQLEEKGFFSKIFVADKWSGLYCHFCMARVCSRACLFSLGG